MKKAAALLLALTLCFGAAGAVWADAAGGAQTTFTLTVEENNDPSYLITIPNEVSLSLEGPTPVIIQASEVKDLDGQRISVRFGGTQNSESALFLNGVNHVSVIKYKLNDAQGNPLLDTRNGNSGMEYIGVKELVSFSGNGTASYQVEVCQSQDIYIDPTPIEGVSYTGTLTYDIALVD